MKAICNREGLLSALQVANAAVPSRDVKPILKNVKAIAGEDRCVLMATDLELGIRLEVRSLKAEEPGEAILPAACHVRGSNGVACVASERAGTADGLAISGRGGVTWGRQSESERATRMRGHRRGANLSDGTGER